MPVRRKNPTRLGTGNEERVRVVADFGVSHRELWAQGCCLRAAIAEPRCNLPRPKAERTNSMGLIDRRNC